MKPDKYTVQLAALLAFSTMAGFLQYGLELKPDDVVQVIKAYGMLLLAIFGVAANTVSPEDAP